METGHSKNCESVGEEGQNVVGGENEEEHEEFYAGNRARLLPCCQLH